MTVGIASRSANAADVCGDRAQWWPGDGNPVVAIADGLGHGVAAAQAAAAAMDYISMRRDDDLLTLFEGMNLTLSTTRGAAVGVARVDLAARSLTYAAIGNTRAVVFGWRTTRLEGYAGIVGGGYRSLKAMTVPFHPGDALVLWTDGVEELLELSRDKDFGADSAGLAERLLNRFLRGKDDACVVVARLDAD